MRNWFGGFRLTPAMAGAGLENTPQRQEKLHTVLRKEQSDDARRTVRAGGTAQFRAPQQSSGITRRAVFSLLLLLIVPPLGMLLIWRRRIFQTRGRVLLTVLSALLLAVEIFLLLPTERTQAVQPAPVQSALRTAIPVDDTLNALSNMDELLAGVENTVIDNTDLTDTGETVEQVEAEATEEPSAETDVLQTVVYCVRSGAKYYHTSSECNGQVNRRSLTVEQAISEGLTACKRCNPPSP